MWFGPVGALWDGSRRKLAHSIDGNINAHRCLNSRQKEDDPILSADYALHDAHERCKWSRFDRNLFTRSQWFSGPNHACGIHARTKEGNNAVVDRRQSTG
jgi:hypothetical protein